MVKITFQSAVFVNEQFLTVAKFVAARGQRTVVALLLPRGDLREGLLLPFRSVLLPDALCGRRRKQ